MRTCLSLTRHLQLMSRTEDTLAVQLMVQRLLPALSLSRASLQLHLG